jgi:hypothetical protein
MVVAGLCAFLAVASVQVGGRLGQLTFWLFAGAAFLSFAKALEGVFAEPPRHERRLDRWS